MITSMKHNSGISQSRDILLWLAPSGIHVRSLEGFQEPVEKISVASQAQADVLQCQ